jgi:chromosome segregation ATPase
MSTLKNVANKLFKVELESHKVDLGLLQDLKKLSDAYSSQSNKFNSEVDKIKNAIKSMQTEFISLTEKVSEVDNEYQKARRLALDLGIDLPTEVVAEYKKVLSLLKTDSTLFKEYNK